MKGKLLILFIFLTGLVVSLGCGTPTVSKKEAQNISEPTKQEKSRKRGGFYYTVKKGENLSKIARKYGVSTDKISELNHLPDSNKIKPGQMLYIPKSPDKIIGDKKEIHLIWPVKGEVVESFNDEKEKGKINLGIDIKFSSDKKIVAAEKGKVIFCNKNEEFDLKKKLVILKHRKDLNSIYILDGEILVNIHELVKKGQPILRASSKSDNILHFEVRKNHVPKNPYYFLP